MRFVLRPICWLRGHQWQERVYPPSMWGVLIVLAVLRRMPDVQQCRRCGAIEKQETP